MCVCVSCVSSYVCFKVKTIYKKCELRIFISVIYVFMVHIEVFSLTEFIQNYILGFLRKVHFFKWKFKKWVFCLEYNCIAWGFGESMFYTRYYMSGYPGKGDFIIFIKYLIIIFILQRFSIKYTYLKRIAYVQNRLHTIT